MKNTTVIGYRVQTQSGMFVHAGHNGGDFVACFEPAPDPIPAPDAYRRLADYISSRPTEPVPSVVPVTSPLTALESTAGELADLLQSLTVRHGLDLGLSRDQVVRQITKELVEIGANRG
jgi:hypothetical protein